MMDIRWHRSALTELEEAAEYYEVKNKGLGQEFLAEIEHVIGLIAAFPDAWAKVSTGSRRCRARRFPYGVVYQAHPDHVTVIAVMHLARAPDYWRNREE